MFWGYLGLFIIAILYRKILHTVRSKLQPGQGFSLIVVTNHMICESDAIYVYLFFNSRDFSTIIIATHV